MPGLLTQESPSSCIAQFNNNQVVSLAEVGIALLVCLFQFLSVLTLAVPDGGQVRWPPAAQRFRFSVEAAAPEVKGARLSAIEAWLADGTYPFPTGSGAQAPPLMELL